MKRYETFFPILAAVSIVSLCMSACTSNEQAANPTPTSAVTPTADTAPTATAGPEAEATRAPVADEDLIAAAVSELDTSIATGNGPEDTIAYDLLDTAVNNEGFVTLTICTWTGETVFNTVRASLFRTTIEDNGTIKATHITSPVAPGDCLNTTLIETALDFIDEYDTYWAGVAGEPTSFETDDRAAHLLEENYGERARDLAAGFVESGIYFEPAFISVGVRDDRVADFLYRRSRAAGIGILEIVVCRPMNPAHGAYRDGALVDDGRSDTSPGLHAIDAYSLARHLDESPSWQLAGTDALAWADCFETGDWPSAANVWRQSDNTLEVLEQ